MAALRDIARDFAAEIRDGIGWTIVYRTGRSWNALTIWSDIWNGEWETDDLNDAIGILKADPDAVIVNGYYCGHFGEDMTIDEIAAGIRWHYEGGRNRLADYCEVTQGRDALEEGRKAAEAAGLPFCERLADGGDDELSPYVYDGSMTLADREKMQQAREAFEKLADALREIAAKLAEALKPVINVVLSALKKLWKVSAKAIGVPPKWLHLAAHAKKANFNPPAPCGAGQRSCTKKTVQNIAYCTKSAFTLAVLSGFPALMRPFFLPNVHKFRCEPSEESLLAPRSHAYTIRTPSG